MLRDEAREERDALVVQRIGDNIMRGVGAGVNAAAGAAGATTNAPEANAAFLRYYFEECSKLRPVLQDDAAERLKEFYVKLRREE